MLLPDEMVDAVVDTVSGTKALDYVMEISRFHRIQGTPGLMDALNYVKNEVERISQAKTELHEYDAGGEGKIGEWEQLYGWKPKSGKLTLLEPEKKTLADFLSEPISLVAQSANTDLEGEVVYVGRGLFDEDYEGKEVKGKVVLTTSRASRVHRIACIERGAIGVLTYIPPSGIDEIAKIRRYEAIWPKKGEKNKTTFGFALTQADGVKIRDWIEEGKTVKVHAKVEAELGEGKQGVLTALLEGKDTSREIWLMAHICHPHPGANDNASGSAVLLETLRTLDYLIKEGAIQKPDFSIRFVWVPEWHGTIEYIDSQKEALSKCMFVINVDMVGANPAKSGSFMNLFRTPHSLPSTLNNVLSHWLCVEAERTYDASKDGTIAPFRWRYQPYSAGSDHFMFTDRTIAIPAVMLNQFPDKFYHTSADTPDKIDVGQMARASRVVTLAALTLAHPRYACKERLLTIARNEAIDLMHRVSIDAVTILGRCTENPEKVYPRTMRWLGFARDLGMETLDKAEKEWHLISEQIEIRNALKASIDMSYATEMGLARKAYLGACAEVGLDAKEESQFDLDSFESTISIKRKLMYALPPSRLGELDKKRFEKYTKLGLKHHELGCWVDEMLNLSEEWTSLGEIWDRLSFQFGKIDLSLLEDIAADLRDLGVIEYKEA